MSARTILYQFDGSAWCHVPKLAIAEGGFKDGDIEVKNVNLVEGENFNPDYLKINKDGTVPSLVTDGNDSHKYTSTINVTREIIKRAPNPPKKDAHTDHELKKIIETVHSSHVGDPNELLLLPVDDADRAAKGKGVPPAFLGGRQKALDKFAPSAPEEFKAFLEAKQKGNKQLLDLYTGSPDQATLDAIYQKANDGWKAAGNFIRGDLTHLLRKTPGKFLGGADEPGEADFHVITWLARIVSDAGGKPGAVSGETIQALQKRIGSEPVDPVVAGYWDTWTQRPSFKDTKVE